MGNAILGQSEWIIMEKLWEQQPRTIMQLFHSLEVDPGWSKKIGRASCRERVSNCV